MNLSELLIDGTAASNASAGTTVTIAEPVTATYRVASGTGQVQLGFDASQIASTQQVGDDLVLTLTNGSVIRLVDYFDVFESGAGLALAAGAIALDSTALLGAAAGAGVLAAVAGGGGGDGGGDSPTPGVPAINSYQDNVGSVTSTTSTALTTDDARPVLNIGANLVETPKLYVNGTEVATTYNAEDGTLTLAADLAEGAQTLAVTLTDEDGVETDQSDASLDLVIDTTAPAAPEILTSSVRSIRGTAEAGATVLIDADGDGETDYEAVVDSDGNWTVAGDFALGANVTATVMDAAGNAGSATSEVIESLTVAISGSGATVGRHVSYGGGTNTITFEFSEDVNEQSFSVDDIIIENGTIVAGSLSGSGKNWTIEVEPDVAQGHQFVSVKLADDTVETANGTSNDAGANDPTLFEAFATLRDAEIDGDISDWDTSAATDMTRTFFGSDTEFPDITGWNVSNVTNFTSTFNNADEFNQDISGWDVSSATTMEKMFLSAESFNQDITGWDVSNAIILKEVFRNAYEFNQPIGIWDISNATDISEIFSGAYQFNQDVSDWDTSKVTTLRYSFRNTYVFNQELSDWDTSSVTNLDYTFEGSRAFDQSLADWNVSSVTTASDMFLNAMAMSSENMDATINGWATIDAAAGETDLQSGVELTVADTATDATAIQYLEKTFGWVVDGQDYNSIDGLRVGDLSGSNVADTMTSMVTTGETFHGLDGNDTITGGAGDDVIYGGSGDDTITLGAGENLVVYGHADAGEDTITDFSRADDALDVSNLLIGYDAGDDISDWITSAADGSGTTLTIDEDGTGSRTQLVTINLDNVTHSTDIAQDMIDDGSLIVV